MRGWRDQRSEISGRRLWVADEKNKGIRGRRSQIKDTRWARAYAGMTAFRKAHLFNVPHHTSCAHSFICFFMASVAASTHSAWNYLRVWVRGCCIHDAKARKTLACGLVLLAPQADNHRRCHVRARTTTSTASCVVHSTFCSPRTRRL